MNPPFPTATDGEHDPASPLFALQFTNARATGAPPVLVSEKLTDGVVPPVAVAEIP